MAAAGSRNTVTLLSGTFWEVWKAIHKFYLGAIPVVPRHKWYLAQWPQRTAAPKPVKNIEKSLLAFVLLSGMAPYTEESPGMWKIPS